MMVFNPVVWMLALVFALAMVGMTRLVRGLRGTDRPRPA
jgi:hypothetical protein